MIALTNRVHIFTHPKNKDTFTAFFINILGCTVMPLPQEKILFTFSDGSRVSVEFTEEVTDALDEEQARRGAWLELESDDPVTLKNKILEAGYHQFEFKKGFFYFQIPGGQVMRIKLPEF